MHHYLNCLPDHHLISPFSAGLGWMVWQGLVSQKLWFIALPNTNHWVLFMWHHQQHWNPLVTHKASLLNWVVRDIEGSGFVTDNELMDRKRCLAIEEIHGYLGEGETIILEIHQYLETKSNDFCHIDMTVGALLTYICKV